MIQKKIKKHYPKVQELKNFNLIDFIMTYLTINVVIWFFMGLTLASFWSIDQLSVYNSHHFPYLNFSLLIFFVGTVFSFNVFKDETKNHNFKWSLSLKKSNFFQ